MRLDEMRRIGMEVVEAMAPGCTRVMIAGSVRRGKAMPKDIEIIFISRMEEQRVDLFRRELVAVGWEQVLKLVRAGFWEFDMEVKRRGSKYQRLVRQMWPGSEGDRVVIELFRAEEGNWGLQLALRTGPAEFNHLLVTRNFQGGAMPVDMQMRDGWLWRRGVRVETPTESGFFEAIGVPTWAPGERSAARLGKFLLLKGRVGSGKDSTRK